MDAHTLTLALGGRVEIEQLQEGIARFRQRVSALAPGKGLMWVVADLHPGSATITLAAETATPAAAAKAEPVVAEFDSIDQALGSHAPLSYSLVPQRVRKAVAGLQALAHTMEYVRLATPSADYVIPGKYGVDPGRALRVSLGAVTGRAQMLTNRGGLRFNLYAQIHDKAGDCYLQSEQGELMRAAWGAERPGERHGIPGGCPESAGSGAANPEY